MCALRRLLPVRFCSQASTPVLCCCFLAGHLRSLATALGGGSGSGGATGRAADGAGGAGGGPVPCLPRAPPVPVLHHSAQVWMGYLLAPSLHISTSFTHACMCSPVAARSTAEATPHLGAALHALLAQVLALSTLRRSPVDLLLFLEVCGVGGCGWGWGGGGVGGWGGGGGGMGVCMQARLIPVRVGEVVLDAPSPRPPAAAAAAATVEPLPQVWHAVMTYLDGFEEGLWGEGGADSLEAQQYAKQAVAAFKGEPVQPPDQAAEHRRLQERKSCRSHAEVHACRPCTRCGRPAAGHPAAWGCWSSSSNNAATAIHDRCAQRRPRQRRRVGRLDCRGCGGRGCQWAAGGAA